jgi:hypothetical protein
MGNPSWTTRSAAITVTTKFSAGKVQDIDCLATDTNNQTHDFNNFTAAELGSPENNSAPVSVVWQDASNDSSLNLSLIAVVFTFSPNGTTTQQSPFTTVDPSHTQVGAIAIGSNNLPGTTAPNSTIANFNLTNLGSWEITYTLFVFDSTSKTVKVCSYDPKMDVGPNQN